MRSFPWRHGAPPVPILWLSVGLVGLALAAGFLAGLAYARYAAPPGPSAATESAHTPQPAAASTTAGDFALLQEIRGIVEADFYRPANADRQKLVWGAARGMVQALGDPNSVYEAPAEREAGDSRWTGRYEGVGMHVDQRDGQMIVTAPIEGGPAAKAGIRTGDVILEADGRLLAGLTLNEQTLVVRGPKGTTVVLTVRREGVAELLRIPVVRDEIRLISARGRMLDNNLGVLRISQFTEGTVAEARSALETLLAAHPSGLLLDLRGNAGGLLEPAVNVTGFFVGGGPVVTEKHANGLDRSYSAPDAPPLTDLPMLVLVDRGSASASEIMAAALQDRGRAWLLGDRTYGKGTVQYIHRLSDGSGLRITVAEWYSPADRPIPPAGLEPNWLVTAPNPPPEGRDPVLETAVQHLLAQVASTHP